jgi:hypothetical protein
MQHPHPNAHELSSFQAISINYVVRSRVENFADLETIALRNRNLPAPRTLRFDIVADAEFRTDMEEIAMKKSLMVSVAAAALLATTGFATAQGMSQGGSKDAPTSTASPRGEAASPKGEAASPRGDAASPRSESSAPAAGSSMTKESAAPATSKESAAPEMKNSAAPKSGSMAQEKSGAADTKSGTKATPQQAQEQAKEKAGTATDTKTSGAMNNDTKSKASESKASESGTAAGTAKPATADSKTGDTKSTTTTGNAATSATAAPPAEKQTQIVSAIKQEKVEEVTNVNFSISVGARVPTTVHYHPLPSRIVEIYPEWRGYDFIFVHGRYIILRPETHEIVYIIES